MPGRAASLHKRSGVWDAAVPSALSAILDREGCSSEVCGSQPQKIQQRENLPDPRMHLSIPALTMLIVQWRQHEVQSGPMLIQQLSGSSRSVKSTCS